MEKFSDGLTLQELLRGIDGDFDCTNPKAIKLVRHADSRTKTGKNQEAKSLYINGQPFPANITSIYALYVYRKELFMQYQSGQKAGNFKNIKYVVSFIGEEKLKSRFVGVYKVVGQKEDPNAQADDDILLELEPVKAFEHYEKRVVIDWVSPANSWHQYYDKMKPVVCIEEMPDLSGVPQLTPYLDIVFSHAQLQLAINAPDWVTMLRAVNCIYVIRDASNGKLYVGSTYNQQGIHGRWVDYAATGHGDNVDLKDKGEAYCKNNFWWGILEVLPLNVTASEAIYHESLWKDKLGTRIYGYNNN